MSWILIVFSAIFLAHPSLATVQTYAPPTGYTTNSGGTADYSVTANNESVFVYDLSVVPTSDQDGNLPAGIQKPCVAYFSLDNTDSVTVIVTANRVNSVSSVAIRPKNNNVTYGISGKTITFTLTKPQSLSVEVNGKDRPLFLFAKPKYTQPTGPNVRVITGEVTEKVFDPTGIDTIFLAGGAVLKGGIAFNNDSNIKIMGPGIVLTPPQTCVPIWTRFVKNLTLDGPTVINNDNQWSTHIVNSGYNASEAGTISIKNYQVVSTWRDGMDFSSSQNAVADNCFVYATDDSYCVKAYGTNGADSKNITIKNSTAWSGMRGNGLEIGYESSANAITGTTFQNIDIIHFEASPEIKDLDKAVISIHSSNKAAITDVLYDTIRIEDATKFNTNGLDPGQTYLFNFHSWWNYISQAINQGPGPTGKIDGVAVKNVFLNQTTLLPSVIRGEAPGGRVKNVSFEDVYLNNILLLSDDALDMRYNAYGDLATYSGSPAATKVRFTDHLTDWTKLGTGGSNTTGWTFRTNISASTKTLQQPAGDPSVAQRTGNTTQSIVWNYNSLLDFKARIYYYKANADTPDLSKIKFYTSPDGSIWSGCQSSQITNIYHDYYWYESDWKPDAALPPGTNYVKIELGKDIRSDANVFLSFVTFTRSNQSVTLKTTGNPANYKLGDTVVMQSTIAGLPLAGKVVKYYWNGTYIGESNVASSYAMGWTPTATDVYDLQSKVYSGSSLLLASNTVTITVSPPPMMVAPMSASGRHS